MNNYSLQGNKDYYLLNKNKYIETKIGGTSFNSMKDIISSLKDDIFYLFVEINDTNTSQDEQYDKVIEILKKYENISNISGNDREKNILLIALNVLKEKIVEYQKLNDLNDKTFDLPQNMIQLEQKTPAHEIFLDKSKNPLNPVIEYNDETKN